MPCVFPVCKNEHPNSLFSPLRDNPEDSLSGGNLSMLAVRTSKTFMKREHHLHEKEFLGASPPPSPMIFTPMFPCHLSVSMKNMSVVANSHNSNYDRLA